MIQPQEESPSIFRSLALFIFIIGVILRTLASFNNFWLDEIWSLNLAKEVQSPLDIITKVYSSNNHILNTLFMYLIGDQGYWPVYRLPALIAGSGAIIVAGLIGKRRGRLEALIAMFLTACSYLLIHYSSEARGYGLQILFLLLSFYLALQYRDKPGWGIALFFWASSILGILSQLIFIQFYISLAFWSVLLLFTERRETWPKAFLSLVRLHSVPVIFIGCLFWVHIRHLELSGPQESWLKVVFHALPLSIGAPASGTLAVVGSLLVIAAFGWGIIILHREQPYLGLFFLVVVLINFGMVHDFPYVRHFLTSVVFFLILLSYLLGSLYRRGVAGKVIVIVSLSCFLVGNAWHFAQLLIFGRGDYLNALTFIAQQTHGSEITMGSDYDPRNLTILNFYRRYLPKDKKYRYINRSLWPQIVPEWYIIQDYEKKEPPPMDLKDLQGSGNDYILLKVFRSADLSGCDWYVFHNQNRVISK